MVAAIRDDPCCFVATIKATRASSPVANAACARWNLGGFSASAWGGGAPSSSSLGMEEYPLRMMLRLNVMVD